MNEKQRMFSLFNQLCMELGLNNFNENPSYNVKSLKMDFNSIYGGYRINTLGGNGGTGESFFHYSDRMPLQMMIKSIQGIFKGLELQKYHQVNTDKTLGELLDSKDETIKRNAMSILKTLNK